MILAVIEARGSVHIHLTPGDIRAIYQLTQAIGRAFWHMTTVGQCVTVGVPSAARMVWLAKWDPLVSGKKGKKWTRISSSRGTRRSTRKTRR